VKKKSQRAARFLSLQKKRVVKQRAKRLGEIIERNWSAAVKGKPAGKKNYEKEKGK